MFDVFDGPPIARQAIHLLEEKCRSGLFSLDMATGELRLSEGMSRLMGIRHGRLEPSWGWFRGMLHPEDRLWASDLAEMWAVAIPLDREVRVIHHDGRVRRLSLHCEFRLDASGHAMNMIGVATDMTDARPTTRGSFAEQLRFRGIVEGAARVVWAARPDGWLTDVFGWEKATGRPERSALGLDWVDGLHVEDRDDTLAEWRKAVAQGRFYQHEHRVIRVDGGFCRHISLASPVLRPDGSISGWVGLAFGAPVSETDRPNQSAGVTGAQLRGARAILKWSVRELSVRSGLTSSIIRRLEAADTPQSDSAAATLRRVFVDAGVEFPFTHDMAPGVRPGPALHRGMGHMRQPANADRAAGVAENDRQVMAQAPKSGAEV